MPKHAAESGADYVHTGIFEEAEELEAERQRKVMERGLKQKEIVAVVAVMTHSFQLQKALNDISWQFHKLRMKSMDNPEVERTVCSSLKVKSLDEAEAYVKKICVEAFKE